MDVAGFVAPSPHSPCNAPRLPHCSPQAPLAVAQITQLWSPQTPRRPSPLLRDYGAPKEGASDPSRTQSSPAAPESGSAAAQILASPAPARRAAASSNATACSLPLPPPPTTAQQRTWLTQDQRCSDTLEALLNKQDLTRIFFFLRKAGDLLCTKPLFFSQCF